MEANNRIKILRTQKGWSQKQLAERMGISQGQVNKLENSNQELKATHMINYAKALGVSPVDILPKSMLKDAPPPEVNERDAEIWQAQAAKNDNKIHDNSTNMPIFVDKQAMINALLNENPNRSAWVLRSRILDTDGYLPGDVLIVDADRPAKIGDVVCVQIYSRTNADTVFRIYQPPYLITASTNPKLREPRLIDPARTKIMGIVTETIRFKR